MKRGTQPVKDSFKDFVLDQLGRVPGLSCQKMFGGYGLYQGDVFFGIIHGGRLYFRTDEQTRPQYVTEGMNAFRPNQKQTLRSYYEVPVGILENEDDLAVWAQQATRAGSSSVGRSSP